MLHGASQVYFFQDFHGGDSLPQSGQISGHQKLPCRTFHHPDYSLVQWLNKGCTVGWKEFNPDVAEFLFLVRDMVVQEENNLPSLTDQLPVPLLKNFTKCFSGHPSTAVSIIVYRERNPCPLASQSDAHWIYRFSNTYCPSFVRTIHVHNEQGTEAILLGSPPGESMSLGAQTLPWQRLVVESCLVGIVDILVFITGTDFRISFDFKHICDQKSKEDRKLTFQGFPSWWTR